MRNCILTQEGLSELLRPVTERYPQASMNYPERFWEESGLGGYRPDESLTRLQAAVFMDCLFTPFSEDVDYEGNFVPVYGDDDE